MRFTGGGEVVSASVVAPYPPDLGVTPLLQSSDSLTLNPWLMNPSDTFVLSMVYVPAPSETARSLPALEVTGRIAGVEKVRAVDRIQKPGARTAELSVSLVFAIGVVSSLLAFFFQTIAINLMRRLFKERKARDAAGS